MIEDKGMGITNVLLFNFSSLLNLTDLGGSVSNMHAVVKIIIIKENC